MCTQLMYIRANFVLLKEANVFEARQNASNAVTAVAKEQALNNVEFWKLVEKEGLNDDDFFNVPKTVVE